MKEAKMRVKVQAKDVEAEDVCSFYLVEPNGDQLPSFNAGSHIDVFIDHGLVRQYSLCNNPTEQHQYQIAVLKEASSRGGSVYLHENIQAGDFIEISEPRNHFALHFGNHSSLLMGGGIGITPILCMAERLAYSVSNFEFHYFARTRSRAAFLDRIDQSRFSAKACIHLNDEPEQPPVDLEKIIQSQTKGTHIYVCGPAGFIDAVLNAAANIGWPNSHLHREFFKARLPEHSDQEVASEQFTVKLASTGREYLIPSDQSVLQVLAANGIEISSSCEQGVCGSCLTKILEGEPDHRDMFLMPDERARNDQFTPCCSRSKSPVLVLDL